MTRQPEPTTAQEQRIAGLKQMLTTGGAVPVPDLSEHEGTAAQIKQNKKIRFAWLLPAAG